jgi:hypothetical protein
MSAFCMTTIYHIINITQVKSYQRNNYY